MTSSMTDDLMGKESTCNAGDKGDAGLISGSGRPFGEGNGNPLQYSCLKNPMDRGASRATVCGAAESDTTEGLNTVWGPTTLLAYQSKTAFKIVIIHHLFLEKLNSFLFVSFLKIKAK